MNLIVLASVLALSVSIALALSKGKKEQLKKETEFWNLERKANNTRKKSLDDLQYISIPLDELPTELLKEDERVQDYVRIITELSSSKIVNFTGITNTELKLRYGAPNLDLLTTYDQNYTILVRTLQQWATCLYDAGYLEEACQILEFAVSTGTDVRGTFKLLCTIYKQLGEPEQIGFLYPIAETLNSAMKEPICRILQEAEKSGD